MQAHILRCVDGVNIEVKVSKAIRKSDIYSGQVPPFDKILANDVIISKRLKLQVIQRNAFISLGVVETLEVILVMTKGLYRHSRLLLACNF